MQNEAIENDIVQESLALIQQLLENRRWEEAVQLCTKLNDAVPDDPQILYFGGIAAFNNGCSADAEAFFLRLVELVPTLSEAHINLAQLAINRGNADLAIERLSSATALEPGNHELLVRLGVWQLQFGYGRDGRTALSAAQVLDPSNEPVNRILQALAAGDAARCAPVNEKCVVLISDNPKSREEKIGCALLDQGWSVHLFSLSPNNNVDEKNFTDITNCIDPWDAIVKASRLRPNIYHCFAQMKYETIAAFLAAKPGTIVGDYYDNVDMLGEHMFSRETVRHFDKSLERSVFARADGHVCRNLEMQLFARREKNFPPGRRIFFPDYAWCNRSNRPKLSEKDGELHLFYAGSVWIEKVFPELDGDGGYLWLAELLTKQKIHLHIYPSRSALDDFEEVFEHYRELEKQSRYLHLHRTISDSSQFIEEVSQYDIAINIYRSTVDGGGPVFYHDLKKDFGYANKLADAIDGNVYLMINDGFVLRLAKRLNVGIQADSSMYEDAFWSNLKDRVLRNRIDQSSAKQRWSLLSNAPRLVRYYDELGSAVREN